MKKILIVLMTLLLVACSFSKTPEDALKQGNYLEAIELIAVYVEEQGMAKLTNDDLERLRNVVSTVMVHYEHQLLNADRTDYGKRIDSYNSLLKMKQRLSDRFYSQQVYFFNNKYDVIQLRKLIAEEYYLYGNSISPIDSTGYFDKALLYKRGLEYYNYKDIRQLYEKNNKKYMQLAADEYYVAGKQYAESKQYKLAAAQFSSAISVYKPLGQYKDSQQLFVKYDKQYRLDEAVSLYNQASQIVKSANTYRDYRDAAKLYDDAATIYRPYGAYKDAKTLASQYQKKGQISVYIDPSIYSKTITKELTKMDFVKIVGNASAANVKISITQKERFYQPSPKSMVNAMSENVPKLIPDPSDPQKQITTYSTYYFNREVTEYENALELKSQVTVTGALKYSNQNQVIEHSSRVDYRYFGQVPGKYKSYSNGKLLSQKKLSEKANKSMNDKVEADIRIIVQHIDSL